MNYLKNMATQFTFIEKGKKNTLTKEYRNIEQDIGLLNELIHG